MRRAAGPATRFLAALQLSSAASDPVRGLGVLAAYETQAAAVAATKAAGLRRHYGIDGPGVAFWDVQEDLEATTPAGLPARWPPPPPAPRR